MPSARQGWWFVAALGRGAQYQPAGVSVEDAWCCVCACVVLPQEGALRKKKYFKVVMGA